MSQAPSGYERIEGDRYYTPAWVTNALLSVEMFHGLTIDPAAGGWHLVDAMRACGSLCEGFDIAPDPGMVGGWQAKDFLTWCADSDCRNIVTNPPYGKGGRLAVAFIEKALADTVRAGGKVAMLLRIDFDSASGRRKVFGDHPAFAAKYALTKRIRWANLPQAASGPTDNHAWFVWDWARRRDSARAYGYLP